LYSISFSVPLCSRPMCGSARSTTSPFISSTRRSTPWAAGCCGPKLIVKFCTWAGTIGVSVAMPRTLAGSTAWERLVLHGASPSLACSLLVPADLRGARAVASATDRPP
jgi:hypothetical protein